MTKLSIELLNRITHSSSRRNPFSMVMSLFLTLNFLTLNESKELSSEQSTITCAHVSRLHVETTGVELCGMTGRIFYRNRHVFSSGDSCPPACQQCEDSILAQREWRRKIDRFWQAELVYLTSTQVFLSRNESAVTCLCNGQSMTKLSLIHALLRTAIIPFSSYLKQFFGRDEFSNR